MRPALSRYRSAAEGRIRPGYAQAREHRLGDVDLAKQSLDDLWTLHDSAGSIQASTGPSLLDLKIEITTRLMRHCTLCERRCGVDRIAGEAGFCGVGAESSYFFEQVLWGEERPVVPSHEVFFSGCNMRCAFCYSWESVLDTSKGTRVEPGAFAGLIDRRRCEGAVNVNLIGGEPTVHLLSILEALALTQQEVPVVWNSNFLMSEEAMRLLRGVVDLYIGDFRFGNNECAARVGGTDNYFATAARNFRLAAESGDLIIRHLLLPGHVDCCLRPLARWVSENLPDVPFNLMFQYTPFWRALDDPEMARSLTPEEEDEARRVVESLGLNTSQWNQPLDGVTCPEPAGSGEIQTMITIRPDGRVAIQHLHAELLPVVQALGLGGDEI